MREGALLHSWKKRKPVFHGNLTRRGEDYVKEAALISVMMEDLNRALQRFRNSDFPAKRSLKTKEMGIQVAFLPIGESAMEFIHHTKSLKEDDPMERVVRGQKGIINHLCFEVDDLEASIRDFERSGAILVEGCPRPGAHGRVAFFYPETTEGVLIELCEL
jgi:methylmalonyl-CoA/ethylmalonyl-CoA epimerase